MTPTINPSIHGPYEDAMIAAFTLAEKLLDSQPPEIKLKAWNDLFAFFDRMTTFADKIDVLHIFHSSKDATK